MSQHTKRERHQLTASRLQDNRLAKQIRHDEDLAHLAFQGQRGFEVHRRYLYGGLPLQDAPPGMGYPARNGMRFHSLDTIAKVAWMAGMTCEEFSREYAARGVA